MPIDNQDLRYSNKDKKYEDYYSKTYEQAKKEAPDKSSLRIGLSYVWDSVKAKFHRITHRIQTRDSVNSRQVNQLHINVNKLLDVANKDKDETLNGDQLQQEIGILTTVIDQTILIIKQLKKAKANKKELNTVNDDLKSLKNILTIFKNKQNLYRLNLKKQLSLQNFAITSSSTSPETSQAKVQENEANKSKKEIPSEELVPQDLSLHSPAPSSQSMELKTIKTLKSTQEKIVQLAMPIPTTPSVSTDSEKIEAPSFKKEVKNLSPPPPTKDSEELIDIVTPGVLEQRNKSQTSQSHSDPVTQNAITSTETGMVFIPKETAKQLSFMNFEVPNDLLGILDSGENLTLTFTDPQVEQYLKSAIGDKKYKFPLEEMVFQPLTLQKSDLPDQEDTYVVTVPLKEKIRGSNYLPRAIELTYQAEEQSNLAFESAKLSDAPLENDNLKSNLSKKNKERIKKTNSPSVFKLIGLGLLGATAFTLSEVDEVVKSAVLTDAIINPQKDSTIAPDPQNFAYHEVAPIDQVATSNDAPINSKVLSLKTDAAGSNSSIFQLASLGAILGFVAFGIKSTIKKRTFDLPAIQTSDALNKESKGSPNIEPETPKMEAEAPSNIEHEISDKEHEKPVDPNKPLENISNINKEETSPSELSTDKPTVKQVDHEAYTTTNNLLNNHYFTRIMDINKYPDKTKANAEILALKKNAEGFLVYFGDTADNPYGYLYDENHRTFIAVDNKNNIVGFLFGELREKEDDFYVELLVVSENFNSKQGEPSKEKIGTRLMFQAMQKTQELGRKSLYLECPFGSDLRLGTNEYRKDLANSKRRTEFYKRFKYFEGIGYDYIDTSYHGESETRLITYNIEKFNLEKSIKKLNGKSLDILRGITKFEKKDD